MVKMRSQSHCRTTNAALESSLVGRAEHRQTTAYCCLGFDGLVSAQDDVASLRYQTQQPLGNTQHYLA